MSKNHVRLDFSQAENRKTIEEPLKELPWNQQPLVTRMVLGQKPPRQKPPGHKPPDINPRTKTPWTKTPLTKNPPDKNPPDKIFFSEIL